jgi:hypothetical protein
MSEAKALRTIPFDSKTSSYTNWSKRFMSLFTIKDFDQALLHDNADYLIHDETIVIDPKDSDYDQKKENMKANKLAYSMLMLSQNNNVSLHALTSAVTAKRPNGCARMAWKHLEQLHKPKEGATMHELVHRFNQL